MIKYIIEKQMVYSFNYRSLPETVVEFDNFYEALDALEKEAYLYSNNKIVVIKISRYEFDEVYKDYEYLDDLIGFYGVDAAKYLYIPSKKKKYGLIIA